MSYTDIKQYMQITESLIVEGVDEEELHDAAYNMDLEDFIEYVDNNPTWGMTSEQARDFWDSVNNDDESVMSGGNKQYPNTAQGAKDFILDDSTLTEKDLEGSKIIPDPEVDGVWLIALDKLIDGMYNAILVYLNEQDYELIEWRDHPKKFDETAHTNEEAYTMFETEPQMTNMSPDQLAAISDEALDSAYGYGRSTPGNSFGWQANLKSAEFAKKVIDAGVTDIEKISDAIHKGWNITAKQFVRNPDQFSDTEKLRAAGKLEAKLEQRNKLSNIDYAQLPEDEKEKDRVVARALLKAIKGQPTVETDMNLMSVAEEVISQDVSGEIVSTSGDGLWSDDSKPVTLRKMEVDQVTANFGELRIYFDTTSWDIDQDGLIYTDSGFLDGVKKLLSDRGVDTENLDYSEQGMQGNDYVSFDVGDKFLQSWRNEDNEMYEDDDYDDDYARQQHGPEDYLDGQRFVGGESHETGDTVTKTVVGHRDNETKMMQRELQKIEKYAAEISSMMDSIPDGDYPHWWQAKLVKAGDYISTIKHFLEAELENMNEPEMPTDLGSMGFDLSYDDLIAPDRESF